MEVKTRQINFTNISFNKKSEVIEYNNLKELINSCCRKYKTNTAFVIKHKQDENKNFENISYENITYGQILKDINYLGTALYSLGLSDKKIAIIGQNRYEWVISYLAILMGNMVCVPLDKDLQLNEIENSLIRSKADCIIYDKKLQEKIDNIKKQNNTNLEKYICMQKSNTNLSISSLIELGKQLLESGNTSYINSKIDNNKMSVLLFTSGTTSKPKAVMLSHRNLASNIFALQSVEDIRQTDVNIAFLPYHHILGSIIMIAVLAFGAKTAFPDGLRYIKQNLNEYSASIFVGVPLLVESIYKNIEKEIEKQGKTKIIELAKSVSCFMLKFGVDIRRTLFKQIIEQLGGNLRLIISGGAKADPQISKSFNELGIDVFQGYGLSETSPVIAVESPGNIKCGSVGKPVINDIIDIVDKDENGIGQIRVKRPNVMLGYYEDEAQTNEVLKNGWFYTGDLGYFDDEGFLYVTGRSKNMIVLKSGKKVFPEEIETLVNRLDFVEESLVFGMPANNDENDLKLSVKIVYNEEEIKNKYPNITNVQIYNLMWEQIKELNKTFPRYKHIQNMILSNEELIKTTTKKVKRQEEINKILKDKK